ncbi:MAG: hypothetical protein MI784_08635 [Cytophagales bacterium]|nr:hypothetical protein [Cytophagales bacterium]
MERRDYIQKQIDQLTKALANLLKRLLNTPSQGDALFSEVRDSLFSEHLDIDKILSQNSLELINFLEKEYQLTNEQLAPLADILYLLAQKTVDPQLSKTIYLKALVLFNFLEQNESTFSMDRHFKIEQCKSMLR